MEKHSYGTAILSAFEYLLENYPEAFIIGQGLWSPWYVGNSMTDLDKKFGLDRVIDTPVSESACSFRIQHQFPNPGPVSESSFNPPLDGAARYVVSDPIPKAGPPRQEQISVWPVGRQRGCGRVRTIQSKLHCTFRVINLSSDMTSVSGLAHKFQINSG